MPDDRAHAGNDPAAVLEGLPPYPFPNPTALEPPPEWAQLRARCPVARIELASGDEALLLTRYDDVRAMLSDPRFSRQLDADDASRVSDSDDGGVFEAGLRRRPAARWPRTSRRRRCSAVPGTGAGGGWSGKRSPSSGCRHCGRA